jgi:DNA primase
MTITPQFLDELKSRLTLSDLVGKRVRLSRAGREFKGCCPFHKENTPSFYVNDDKQFFHCFGCGAHGDAVGFTMQHDNLTFIEAVETLAAQAGMQVPKPSREDVERAQKEKSLHTLMDDATAWFAAQLHERTGRDALQYMQGRGVSDDLSTAFRIGYAPEDGKALIRALKEKGYTEAQMIEVGLARKSQRDSDVYSFFRDRVMFPVMDRRGRVVAFGGRILPEHLRPSTRSDSKPPKYINSSDSPLFHKGRMLYAENHARQAAAEGQPLIVVEGYLDVMACFQAGFKGAVAPLGTALTEEQILILWKMIPEREKIPVLCFDGDNAGRRAAARAVERILPLLKPDQSAKIVFLPDGEDPDSLIKNRGRSAFQSGLDSGISLLDFLWMQHTNTRSFATPESRAGLEAALEEDALKIADKSVQNYYRRAFRDLLFKNFSPKKNGKNNFVAPVQVQRPVNAQDDVIQRVALAIIINHPNLFGEIEDDLERLTFHDRALNSLRQSVIAHLHGTDEPDRAALIVHLTDAGFADDLAAVLRLAAAGFARIGAERDVVLAGWRDMMARLESARIAEEKRALTSTDMTEENWQRFVALQAIQQEPAD